VPAYPCTAAFSQREDGSDFYKLVSRCLQYTVDFTHFFNRFIKTARAVRSIDLIFTRMVGVMGEFPAFNGLKFRTDSRILFAIDGRVLIRIERQFKVAFTRIASLLCPLANVSIWSYTSILTPNCLAKLSTTDPAGPKPPPPG
jgi:hypothetical protein